MTGGLLLTLAAFAGFGLAFLGYAGLLGRLPPNRWAGIRTPFTRASTQNWYDTHRAAAPIMIFGGILAGAVALAFLPFAFAEEIGPTFATIVVAACAVLILITAFLGWYAGTSFAAGRAQRPSGE
jgi:uncharacterized membrane protein